MASTIPSQLLELLLGMTLRVRTGLWLLPPAQLDVALDEATRAGIGAVDLRHEFLAALPPNAAFVALSPNRVLELLDQIASRPASKGCALVNNIDLLLARLTVVQRIDVWTFVFNGLAHRSTALLIAMPATAHSLLPATDALEQWQRAGRVCLTPVLH